MRTLKLLNLIHDNNYYLFPQGAILNETDNNEGTPVVREVYGDILSNVYKIITEAGFNFNNSEDNEQNGYQLFDALKSLFENKNLTEFILSKESNSYKLNLDLSKFPDKSFVIAKSTENYSNLVTTIKGIGSQIYNFSSEDFSAGNELLIILDQSGVRCVNLSKSGTSSLFSVIDFPLQFLDNLKDIWYFNDSKVYNNKPKQYDLYQFIQDYTSAGNIYINNVFAYQKHLIILAVADDFPKCFYLNLETEDFGEFKEDGFSFQNAITTNIFSYYFGSFLYVSNNSGSSSDSKNFHKLNIDLPSKKIIFSGSFVLNSSYIGNSNGIYANDSFLIFDGYNLKNFRFDGTVNDLGDFSEFSGGSLLRTNDAIFYSDGNSLIVWDM